MRVAVTGNDRQAEVPAPENVQVARVVADELGGAQDFKKLVPAPQQEPRQTEKPPEREQITRQRLDGGSTGRAVTPQLGSV